ncbi:TPA: hypothetical protein HA318_05085 [Candidatus Micrarchaeota archaeon]|nr:MAG: hypothetical protein AUJ65_05235 [Candidatus Micrarchaeota archaeon CG1_02_51_15]HII39347.1 hypothetical protein [Candidatus Micrarchaeota archaeon]
MQNKVLLWALLFLVLALIVLPYAGLLQANASKTPSGISLDLANKFVEDDARTNYDRDSLTHITSLVESGEQWKATAEIELNPHTACPKLLRRYYTLMPMSFIEEKIVSTCEARKPIGHRVEAIIAYAQTQESKEGYYCAFQTPLSYNAVREYCPEISAAETITFSQSNPSAKWIVALKQGATTRFIAMDDYTNVSIALIHAP